MEPLTRVFYHELGHFVAHELNKIASKGLGVDSIYIHEHSTRKGEYLGGTVLTKPPEYDENSKEPPPIDRLPNLLASLIYGCIFQAYFLGQKTLYDCQKENGKNDCERRTQFLRAHAISDCENALQEIDSKTLESYFWSSILNDFRVDDVKQFMDEKAGERFEIEMNKLQDHFGPIISKHNGYYSNFIDQYRSVIQAEIGKFL